MPLQKGIHVWAAYRSVHDEVNMQCENCHTHKIDSPNHLLRFNRLAFPRTQQAVMAACALQNRLSLIQTHGNGNNYIICI